MKKILTRAVLLQSCLLLAVAGTAQAADEPAESYIYGTYFVCDVTQQERADEIFKTLDQPFYDAAVADGTLTAYSYYAHQTGGKWRRGLFSVAPSIQALLDAQKKIGDQIDAKNKKLSTEFGRICNSHNDYIWRSVAGNTGAVHRRLEKPRSRRTTSATAAKHRQTQSSPRSLHPFTTRW